MKKLPPNKPFRDLAWGLASQGIAVLRYDKRTKVYAANLKREKIHSPLRKRSLMMRSLR